jgi:polysaccharide biosynthesis/export protein
MHCDGNRKAVIGFALSAVSSLLLASSCPAQQAPAATLSPAQKAEAETQPFSKPLPDERYRIGPGDVLEVRVFERPQLSREAMRVDGNGRIRMPLIQDEFVAACQTESELAEKIAARYRTYLKNPEVDVFVKEFNSEPVAVIGAVNKPGSFQLQRTVRLRELLTLAGGPSPDAGESIQVIHDENSPVCDGNVNRATVTNVGFTPNYGGGAAVGDAEASAPADTTLVSINLHAILRGARGSNPYIRPGDFIHIPKADQVFVVGNVYKPSSLALTEPLTVSRAIAMAGGVLPSTKRSKIRIIRDQGEGNTELYVDLEQIDRHQQADLQLEANDIVEVPTSIGKLALRGFFTGIVPAYAIYAPLTQIR